MKLSMLPEQHPHIGINGARLAAECTSVLLFSKHYYDEYTAYAIPELPRSKPKLQATDVGAYINHKSR